MNGSPDAGVWQAMLDKFSTIGSAMTTKGDLQVKVFADGADLSGIKSAAEDPFVRGFTTNPTLMRKAGVGNYEHFAREALQLVQGRPISFEVFSDNFRQMGEQALKLASWGENVYVKIPVTDTFGASAVDLIHQLSSDGVQVNATALLTIRQVTEVTEALETGSPAYVSLFAGRIADTGRDPVPSIKQALEIVHSVRNVELIWASPREVFNVVQAHEVGCDIITVTHDLLVKLELLGRDLTDYSLDTVRMFHTDARQSAYTI
jgi:transaldolase